MACGNEYDSRLFAVCFPLFCAIKGEVVVETFFLSFFWRERCLSLDKRASLLVLSADDEFDGDGERDFDDVEEEEDDDEDEESIALELDRENPCPLSL